MKSLSIWLSKYSHWVLQIESNAVLSFLSVGCPNKISNLKFYLKSNQNLKFESKWCQHRIYHKSRFYLILIFHFHDIFARLRKITDSDKHFAGVFYCFMHLFTLKGNVIVVRHFNTFCLLIQWKLLMLQNSKPCSDPDACTLQKRCLKVFVPKKWIIEYFYESVIRIWQSKYSCKQKLYFVR